MVRRCLLDGYQIFILGNEAKATLEISASFGADAAQYLNKDTEVKQRVAKALKKIYRYDGPFVFENDDIPF